MGIKGNKQKGKNTMNENENDKKNCRLPRRDLNLANPTSSSAKGETADHFNNLKVFFSAIYAV